MHGYSILALDVNRYLMGHLTSTHQFEFFFEFEHIFGTCTSIDILNELIIALAGSATLVDVFPPELVDGSDSELLAIIGRYPSGELDE